MLRVVTGRFHPHLESALVDHVCQAKKIDPLAPVAVLVPSKPLLDRLRRLLAVEQQLSLLNLHCLTFHQFALRLADEARRRAHTVPLRVVDDVFFERLVRHLARSRLSSLAPFQHIGDAPGTWSALWSTIRDLKDAGVDPLVALRGLGEDCFESEDAGWLEALFSLHAAVKEVGNRLAVGTADDLAESLIPLIPASPFVASLSRIFYYGFYDLTQVQLSLFEAVSRTAATTLFFPLDDSASFDFSRRFFDRYVQPLPIAPGDITWLQDRTPSPIALFVRSVIGVEEELAATCRTILDLVETNGYRVDEIGVVARTLDPYRIHLQSIFDRHRVPFTTTAVRPLIQEPICKLLLQLASLPANDFYRTAVLDVVTSPLYGTELCDRRTDAYRPEQWKHIAAVLGITKGVDEWKRVKAASKSPLTLDAVDEETDAVASWHIEPEVVALFWRLLDVLLTDCLALPRQGTVGQLVDACQSLIERHLFRPHTNEISGTEPYGERFTAIWEAIDGMWARLRELDSIGEELTWPAFVELLTHAMDRSLMPIGPTPHLGVAVLDVMAARGIPFKALFVLGLNEKVFPRYIREDAFLRDRHRRVLDTTLGFKIDEKLAGYEEETLLFSQLCQAASHRLYLSYQRADDAGRMLAASPYLASASHRFRIETESVEALPRRLTDRVEHSPTMRRFLPPADLAQWIALRGGDPADLLQATGRDAETFRHAAGALDRMEEDGRALNPFDGLTGPLDAHWSRILQRGIAPTPLERYARCPFQYFSADVLRLEPARLPIHQGPDAALLGTLCHAALRRCYEQLAQVGWPAHTVLHDRRVRCVREAVQQAAAECEARHQTGRYLLWELAKEQVSALVLAAVEADEAVQTDEPYSPIAFEVEAEGTISLSSGSTEAPFKTHGRMDRIDRHRQSGAVRIIDYKFKAGRAMKAEDRNLLQAALRGTRLQPPFYASLNLPDFPAPSQTQFFFLAPQWPAPIVRSTVELPAWSSDVGARIRRTIRLLVEGIQHGRFFILPDSYCDTCAFRVACRREHAPTWWRAHRADEPRALRDLRAQRLKDG